MKVTFYGATRTVTGSKYLVETKNKKILIDCGLFQGRKELRERNREQPEFDVKSIDAVILTHAHIDHSGYLPLIVKQGYTGPIYCTEATADLLDLLLPDSARLQEEEAFYHNRHSSSRHTPALPLYTEGDAKRTLEKLVTFKKDERCALFSGIEIGTTSVGHILGAISINLDAEGKRISFSGDVGRYDVPILPDPKPIEIGDLLICESTYGDRLHDKVNTLNELERIIKNAKARGGALIIPAFAVGRTQHLLYLIAELEEQGRIPIMPVFVDSPMAVDVTKIYRKYHYDFDNEAKDFISKSGSIPLVTANTEFCKTVDESKRLNSLKGSRIIISASGMVNGGRILHHMANGIEKEQNTILFVGYQAEETRGGLIQSGADEVKIFGKFYKVRAAVETISALSGHGDRDELVRWLRSSKGNPSNVKLVHGEEASMESFAETLKDKFSWKVTPAEYLESVEI